MIVGSVGRLNITSAAIAACLVLAVSTPVLAQQAVQWRVQDGGNGHWYQLRFIGSRSWNLHRESAEALGGHLVTITSQGERNFVRALIPLNASGLFGATIGLYQVLGSPEPGGGWRWVTGEPFEVHDWFPGEPNNGPGGGEHWARYRFTNGILGWNDVFEDYGQDHNPFNPDIQKALVEWSADCDGNGVVDYGEILDGTLEDTNANGVPDCCDAGVSCDPCPGDLNASNTVDAEDLAYVLFAWGTDGGKTPEADINHDGTVNANDLSVVLGSWGACP